MNEPQRLVPQPMRAAARSRGRLGVAFGRRFFLLLAIGVIWLGPAFTQPKFVYAMLAWDFLVLVAWAVDLAGMPLPAQLLVEAASDRRGGAFGRRRCTDSNHQLISQLRARRRC